MPSHRINGSDDIIKYTIIGAAVGGSAFISICGITLGCFRYCRRRGILYMCLNKSTRYRVPEITLADFTISSESSLIYHRDETEYSIQEYLPLDEFDSRNIQATSTRNIYVRRTDNATSTDSVVSLDIPTLRDLEKYSLIMEGNLKMDFFQDSHTQTKTSNFETRRTIFGTPFDCTYVLDETNPILQMPYSDAQMNLPISMTKAGQVEVSASTFRNIEATTKKLDLPDDEFIASPVVEYAINGAGKLDGYACVRLPFVGKATDLKVKKFESDEGLETVAKSTEIPRKHKQNEDLDLYYIVQDSTVLIYTQCFSGFYCTRCKCKREEDLELIAFVFGSYKRIRENYEVYITVYVADLLLLIEDYKKEMFEYETIDQKRVCLGRDIQLEMPDCDLDGRDYIEACLKLKADDRKWMHTVHPRTGRPVYAPKQKIKLASVAKKCEQCQQHHTVGNIRSGKTWYLNNVENTVPNDKFQCYIDLHVCKKDTEVFEPNIITIDELELRAADRDHIKDSSPVQETDSSRGACPSGAIPKTALRKETGTIADYPVPTHQSQTFVRAESEPDLVHGRRHNPPSPELSQVNETMPFQALLLVDLPGPDDSQNQT